MGLFDQLRSSLQLDDEEPLMGPPPPDEKTRRLIELVKAHEPSQHARDEQSREVIQRALEAGRAASIPPPPAPPPPLTPDQEASPSERPADVIARAGEQGRIASDQFPAPPSHLDALKATAATALRQAGRGVSRLQDAAESPFPWERPTGDMPGQQSLEPGGPNASMPLASYGRPEAVKALERARALRGGSGQSNDAPQGKADLLAAIDKVAKPPEAEAESPAPAVGQAPSADDGNPVRSLAAKLSTGAMSEDPRTAGLREALARSARMKEMANHVQGMGIGADLVEGTHVHGDQGKGLRDQADDVVRDAMLPTSFEQKNQRFDTEQARAAQESKLRDSTELRAEHGDTRAASEELRRQKGFETTQGETDPKSTTSANARASIEALYPTAWGKIPQQVRDGFSAADVKRIFGEVAMKDFATGGGAGGRQAGMEGRFEEKQVQDYNKNRITDRTLSAVNNLMGRLDDKSPIQGFDAAKGWAKAEKVPVLGGLLSGAGNSAVRGTEMEGIAQDAMSVMQQISLDTSGKVLNEHEIQNIEKRLGLAAGQGEDAFRMAMKREFDAIQAKADRDYASLSPGAREKVDQRKLRPVFKASESTGYAPKDNTVLDERAKDTRSSLGMPSEEDAAAGETNVRDGLKALLKKARSYF